jgi:hypothetical protein
MLAAALLDYAVESSESETSSFSLLLDGKEQFKDLGLCFLVYPSACITDDQLNIGSKSNERARI